MKLDFIPLDQLYVDKSNMRCGKKPPDIGDILPTVRKRGVLQPLIVRPGGDDDRFGIVAGSRRFRAAQIVAEERIAANDNGADDPDPDPGVCLLPCAILEAGDDAAAIEASLIENVARLDPDEVTQWVTFTKLVREGRDVSDIAATFGIPDLAVHRVLALGNLLPRIRDLYAKEQIDRATVRHLTMATKRQQQDWLRLVDDPDQRAPTGSALKAWLTGGQSIPARLALFDVEASGLATVADLFGEDCYFADPAAFWEAQNAAIAVRSEAYRAEGWREMVVVPPGEWFNCWDHDKLPKRKGGRVYIDVSGTGEVVFHEGYISRRERQGVEREASGEGAAKPARPEVTAALDTYIDLHRHAAVRAALTSRPGVALRLMAAHAIAGSPLWRVRIEPQASREEGTRESVAGSLAETVFERHRRAVLDLLGFGAEEMTVTGGCGDTFGSSCDRLSAIFLRLIELPDAAVLDVIAVVMGETLMAGSPAVAALGLTLGLDMADWWQADPALFDLIRDKEALGTIVAEVAGPTVADANAREAARTLKKIVSDHLAGADGRAKVERWVPRWMGFPPAAYTERGGVGSVRAHARVAAVLAKRERPEGVPVASEAAAHEAAGEVPAPEALIAVTPEPLAA